MKRKMHVIKLIGTTSDVNDLGDPITIPTERQVFAEKKSIRQSEFYQAAATGLRPDLMFVVWSREYRGEQRLEYQGKEYSVIRTYEPNSEETEIVCRGIVNKGE